MFKLLLKCYLEVFMHFLLSIIIGYGKCMKPIKNSITKDKNFINRFQFHSLNKKYDSYLLICSKIPLTCSSSE